MELCEDVTNFDEFDIIESDDFYESRDEIITKMLQDSLDLVVSSLNLSYSTRRDVGSGMSTGSTKGFVDKGNSFLNLIQAYHLITFCSYEKKIDTNTISNKETETLAKLGLNLAGLFYILRGIINKVSFEQIEIRKDFPNIIRGRFNSKKYLQQYSDYTYSHSVPCIVKKRKYDSIENDAVCVSIILSLKKLSKIHYSYLKQYPKSEVSIKINQIYNRLYNFLKTEFFIESVEKASHIIEYNDKFLIERFLTKVESKFAKNLIRNRYYLSLIIWLKVFNRFDDEISDISIDYLLPLSADKNQTVNILFEYWVLKQILVGLQENSLVKINIIKPIASTKEETESLSKYICYFKYKENNYYLYYQITEGICYNEDYPPMWKKTQLSNNEVTKFGGRPDYCILIESQNKSRKKTIIIDAKNKPGNKNGTEEVYKIIGYFDNFQKKLNSDATGILIFRKNRGQDNWKKYFDSVYEKNIDNKKAKVWKFGIDPSDKPEELSLQRAKIVKVILESTETS